MSRYTELMSALGEAVAYEKGELENVRADKITVSETSVFSPDEIRQIRIAASIMKLAN